MKNKKSSNLQFGLILTGIALVCIFVGILVFTIIQKNFNESKKNWIETTGVLIIDEVGSKKKASVHFKTSDGSSITVALNTYDASMSDGKRVSIYYDPVNPNNVRLGSTVLFSFIFLLIFCGIGSVFLFNGIKSIKNGHKNNYVDEDSFNRTHFSERQQNFP